MELFPSFASVLMTDPFFRPLNLRPQQQQQGRARRFSGASMLCDVTDKVDKFEVVAGRCGSPDHSVAQQPLPTGLLAAR